VESLYAQLAHLLVEEGAVAVATVVATRGSTPREAGAKMLVRRTGQTLGTVGGGCGEAAVWRAALEALYDGQPRVVEVDLTGEPDEDSGDLCGGTMEVLVECWTSSAGAGPTSDLEVAACMAERLERRKASVLATVVSGGRGRHPEAGRRAVVGGDGTLLGGLGAPGLDEWLCREGGQVLDRGGIRIVELDAPVPTLITHHSSPSTGSGRLLLEAVLPPPRLLVMGAGHISVPLARMGKMMGFSVAVLDDRPSFANRERFPEAEVVLAADFSEGIKRLDIDRSSYVVLVTRGHRHDVDCLRELAGSDLAYLGMIGSRRRVRAVFDLLTEEGVPRERLERVHAPIGLDIGARTPEEIALSIMAEVVKVHRGGRAASLREAG
jgi:xanthine dehydrogenase accessory factor